MSCLRDQPASTTSSTGIHCPRSLAHPTLAASIMWAVLVWWLGEGLGRLFAGPVMPIMGLPGAVVLYAFIAVLLWY